MKPIFIHQYLWIILKIFSFLLGTTSIGTLHDSVYVKLLTKLEAFTSDPPAPLGDTPSRNGQNVDGSRTGLIWVGSDVTARYLRGDSRCRQPRSTDRPEPGGEPGATLDRGVRHRCGRSSCSGVDQVDRDVLWGRSSGRNLVVILINKVFDNWVICFGRGDIYPLPLTSSFIDKLHRYVILTRDVWSYSAGVAVTPRAL